MKKALTNIYVLILFILIFVNNFIVIYGLMMLMLFFIFVSNNIKFKPIYFYFTIPLILVECLRLIYYQHFDNDFFNIVFILTVSFLYANCYVINYFIVIVSYLVLLFSLFFFQFLQELIPYSGNHVVRIIMLAVFIINSTKRSKLIEFSSLFILLFSSFLSSSRSGILISFISILLLFFLYFSNTFKFKVLVLTSFPLLLYLIFDLFISSIDSLPLDLLNPDLALKITNEGVSSYGRESIISFILVKLDLKSFAFGFPNHFIFNSFGFESHNSYLELFSYYGFFVLFLFIIISIYISFLLLKNGENMLFVLFVFILSRSFFDNFLFINNFDFTFIYFVCLINSFKYSPLHIRFHIKSSIF